VLSVIRKLGLRNASAKILALIRLLHPRPAKRNSESICRSQRRRFNPAELQSLSRDLLNSLNHSVSVNGPKSGDLQEQHVERGLEKLGVAGCLAVMPRPSRYQDTAEMPKMPRYGCAPAWCS
jgi:hypothetical protein